MKANTCINTHRRVEGVCKRSGFEHCIARLVVPRRAEKEVRPRAEVEAADSVRRRVRDLQKHGSAQNRARCDICMR